MLCNSFQEATKDDIGVEILKVMQSGLEDLIHGAKLTARGYENILRFLCERPDLKTLNNVLEELLPVIVPRRPMFPQTQVPTENVGFLAGVDESGVKMTPKRINKKYGPTRFLCRVCLKEGASWCGIDSHIRRVHSKIYYGPCVVCKQFMTSNRSSFRTHQRHCAADKHKSERKEIKKGKNKNANS